MSQHIHNLMGESMKGLRDLVDVDCIVGKPIVTASGTTIIPISKVTFGFGSGGSDIPKQPSDDYFGGGSGAGVTIQPICFLVERDGDVRILNVTQNKTAVDSVVNAVPGVIDRVSAFMNKKEAETDSAPAEAPKQEL